jgi:Helix-turn-helix domain
LSRGGRSRDVRSFSGNTEKPGLAFGLGRSDFFHMSTNDRSEPPPGPLAKIAYRVPEAALTSGLSRSSLYIWMKRGDLQYKKCGNRTLILHDDLVAFMKSLPSFSIK